MLITDEHKEAIIKVLYQHPDWSSGVIHKKCFKYLDKIDVINTIRNHKRKGDNNEIFKEHQRQYLIYNNKKRRLLKYKEKPDSKKQEIIKEWQNDPKGPISDLINKFGVYVETVLYRYKETKEYWDFLAKWEKSHPNAEKRTNRSPKSEARLNVEAALIKNPKLKRPQLYKMFPDVPESNISSWVTSWKSEEVKVKKQKVAAAHAIFLEIYAKSQNCSATEIKIQYFANNEIITRRIVSEWITKYHKEHKDDPKRQKETAPACEKSLRKDERRTEKITKEFNGVSIQSIINNINNEASLQIPKPIKPKTINDKNIIVTIIEKAGNINNVMLDEEYVWINMPGVSASLYFEERVLVLMSLKNDYAVFKINNGNFEQIRMGDILRFEEPSEGNQILRFHLAVGSTHAIARTGVADATKTFIIEKHR